MDRRKATHEELAAVLKQLRWVLTGLQRSGIRDWPEPPESEALPVKCATGGSLANAAGFGFTAEKSPAEGDGGQALAILRNELGDCSRCRLHTTRTRIVFGEGSPEARLVFVGEGPGFDEDRQGQPFVGRAGKLLDKMILALGLRREDVYICNVVKCRPPGNRTPDKDEIDACSPFLVQQIEALRPRVICALGACAAQTLLGTTSPISRLRTKIHFWRGIPFVSTFHPAYLLRNPSQKASAWQDLLEIHRML